MHTWWWTAGPGRGTRRGGGGGAAPHDAADMGMDFLLAVLPARTLPPPLTLTL